VLIHLQSNKGSLRRRFEYLLNRPEGAVEVLYGNPAQAVLAGELIPRKVKSYDLLITFKESYEELVEKLEEQGVPLEEFVEHLLQLVLPPYPLEDMNVVVVAHKDTGHFHLHISVLNDLYGKGLRWPKTRGEVAYFQALREFIANEYGLELGQKRLLSWRIGEFKAEGLKDEVEFKRSLERFLEAVVGSGIVGSLEELKSLLEEELGVQVELGRGRAVLKGKDFKVFLRGEVFSYEFWREQELEATQGTVSSDRERVEERVRELLSKRLERFQKEFEKHYRKVAERGRGRDRGGEEAEPSTSLLSCLSAGRDSGGSGRVVRDKEELSQSSQREFYLRRGALLSQFRGEDGLGRQRFLLFANRTALKHRYRRQVMERRLPYSPEEIDEVKRIPPEVLLSRLGLEWRRVGDQLVIRAPWREEEEPSVFFRVNEYGHTVFKDFGDDEKKGSVIDFVMALNGMGFVEAVGYLRELMGEPVLPEHPEAKLPSSFSRKSSTVKLTKLSYGPVRSGVLKKFLSERNIRKLPKALKEVKFQLKRADGWTGNFFGLGLQTTGGSWIVRTAMRKGNKRVVVPDGAEHSYALVKGQSSTSPLVVVEGLTDYLAVYQLFGDEADYLVLGGVGNLKRALKEVDFSKYSALYVALDTDRAGREATEELLAGIGGKVERVFVFQGPYKDVGEALQKGELNFHSFQEENSIIERERNHYEEDYDYDFGL